MSLSSTYLSLSKGSFVFLDLDALPAEVEKKPWDELVEKNPTLEYAIKEYEQGRFEVDSKATNSEVEGMVFAAYKKIGLSDLDTSSDLDRLLNLWHRNDLKEVKSKAEKLQELLTISAASANDPFKEEWHPLFIKYMISKCVELKGEIEDLKPSDKSNLENSIKTLKDHLQKEKNLLALNFLSECERLHLQLYDGEQLLRRVEQQLCL